MTLFPGQRPFWRLAPGAIFAIAILILLGGIAVIVQSNQLYARSRVEQTQGFADVLAASVAAAVDFHDPVAAQQSVDAYRMNKQIQLIGVYGRDGTLLAGYDRSGGQPPQTISRLQLLTGDEIRVNSPIVESGQRLGIVTFELDRDQGFRTAARYLILFGMFLLTALVVGTVGVAQAQLGRANEELAHRAAALAESNRLLEEQMDERAKAEDQLRQSQKLQALGQLTGGIAHDFNNLLTVIQGSADMLCRPDLAEAKRIRFAQAIVQAAGNAAALTSQLLAFARRQPLKPEKIDVAQLISEMRELIVGIVGERIEVVLDLCLQSCRIEVDRAQLQSAILNMASNARDAMPEGGSLTVRTEAVTAGDGPTLVKIELGDTGSGMNAEIVDRIFEPFFTTKATGKGTGLGLSQVYGFASQSGGEVDVASVIGQGTKIRLVLPCVAEDESTAPAPQKIEPTNQPAAVILVVEGNEGVGAFAEALLSELGHRVCRAHSGEEALELTRAQPFDLVLSDVVMPGMGGLKLARILEEEQPSLPVVLATGYSQEITDSGSGGRPVILKPYRLATLSQMLATVLGAAPPA